MYIQSDLKLYFIFVSTYTGAQVHLTVAML